MEGIGVASGGGMGGINGFSSVDGSRGAERRSLRTIRTRKEGEGKRRGVMLVTLTSANFGTARENFSLGFSRKTRTALDTANRLEL